MVTFVLPFVPKLTQMNKTFTYENKCVMMLIFCTLHPYFLYHKVLNEARSRAANGSRLSR